jgi:hypothetical protein
MVAAEECNNGGSVNCEPHRQLLDGLTLGVAGDDFGDFPRAETVLVLSRAMESFGWTLG